MKEIATVQQQEITVASGILSSSSPRAMIVAATSVANELADFIKKQKLSTRMGTTEYVRVEGWTTLGIMLGVVAREVGTTEKDGVYTSVVELVSMSDQRVLTRASAECGAPDEVDRYGKKTWSDRPRYARRSMAQTRATAKACRLAFSWIMKMAGYEPTPAEEMEGAHSEEIRRTAPTYRTAVELELELQEQGIEVPRVEKWAQKQFGVTSLRQMTGTQVEATFRKIPDFVEALMREIAESTKIVTQITESSENETI